MKRILQMTFLSIAVAISASPLSTAADIVPLPPKTLTAQETIVKYARVYATPEKELMVTMNCESGFKHDNLYGDKGAAYGIAQYHKPTFDRYSKLMGEVLNYKSRDDQIKLMAWQFKNIPSSKREWTCWTKNFK